VNDVDTPLPAALAEVEAWVARRRAPTRHHVRALFIPLGEALLEGRDEAEAFARVATWIGRDPEGWNEALKGELTMAATEHVRSADPRWIANPKYDLAYAVEARHRLEARLTCAEHLGLEVADDVLESIARADTVLAPQLDVLAPQLDVLAPSDLPAPDTDEATPPGRPE